MDEETSWTVITEQRLALADLLDGLTAQEWERPSLCDAWRIRDVAAHVAMAPQPPPLAVLLGTAIRARGDFDRINHDLAVRHAPGPPHEIAAQLRRHAASRRLPVVTNYRNIVVDVLVHGQDIAVPLGRDLPMPIVAARAAADRVWTMGWPFHARRRLRGVRLTATDTDWSAGAGDDVTGPIDALLLLLTGRTTTAWPRLTGPK